MNDRDMEATYDPSKPWHVLAFTRGEWHIMATYDTAVEIIVAVNAMASPESVMVEHQPTNRSGTGAAFLASVNRAIII